MELYVRTWGHGRPVLWIHGYTMDSSLWQPLWELLPGFRHVAVDLPGHGRSGPLAPDVSLPALAACVAAVAREHEARDVVALSFGSCLALELALTEPAALDRLVLAAPTIAGAPAAPGTRERHRELTLLRRMAGPGPHMTGLWMTSPPDIFRGTERHPRLRARIAAVIDRHSWAELGNGAMSSITRHAHTDPMLARIRASTLVFAGEEDIAVFTASAARLAATVPACQVVTVPGAGHLCLLERPEEVAGPLRAHLT